MTGSSESGFYLQFSWFAEIDLMAAGITGLTPADAVVFSWFTERDIITASCGCGEIQKYR